MEVKGGDYDGDTDEESVHTCVGETDTRDSGSESASNAVTETVHGGQGHSRRSSHQRPTTRGDCGDGQGKEGAGWRRGGGRRRPLSPHAKGARGSTPPTGSDICSSPPRSKVGVRRSRQGSEETLGSQPRPKRQRSQLGSVKNRRPQSKSVKNQRMLTRSVEGQGRPPRSNKGSLGARGGNLYQCEVCDRAYPDREQLQEHVAQSGHDMVAMCGQTLAIPRNWSAKRNGALHHHHSSLPAQGQKPAGFCQGQRSMEGQGQG